MQSLDCNVLSKEKVIYLKTMKKNPRGWMDMIYLPDIDKIFLITKEKIQLRDPVKFTVEQSRTHPLLAKIEDYYHFQKLIHLPLAKLIIFNGISYMFVIRYLPDIRILAKFDGEACLDNNNDEWKVMSSCVQINQQLIIIGGNSTHADIINRKTLKPIKKFTVPFARDVYCGVMCYIPRINTILAAERCEHPRFSVTTIDTRNFKRVRDYEGIVGESNQLIDIEKHKILIQMYHDFYERKTTVSLLPYTHLPDGVVKKGIKLKGDAYKGCYAVINNEYLALRSKSRMDLEIYSLSKPSSKPLQVYENIFKMKQTIGSMLYDYSRGCLLVYDGTCKKLTVFAVVMDGVDP